LLSFSHVKGSALVSLGSEAAYAYPIRTRNRNLRKPEAFAL